MPIVLNGTTGITNDSGYTGDGVSFADSTPANTLVTTSGGNVGIGTSSPSFGLVVQKDNGSGYVAGFRSASGSPMLTIQNTGGVSQIQGLNSALNDVSNIAMQVSGGNVGIGTSSPGSKLNVVSATSGGIAIAQGTENFYGASSHRFFTDGYASEVVRIDSSGNLLVGCTAITPNPSGVAILQGSVSYINIGHASGVASGNWYQSYWYAGSAIGSISQNGTTAVSYNTTSDYRLKENIEPLSGALTRIAALKPCTYTWKSAPDEIGEGFIAHELAEVCPQAVTGEKDAVDADGNPVYQGIDTSFLVATLTAAIQELKAEVDSLKAQINGANV